MRHYSQPGAKEKAQARFHHNVVDPAWFGLIDFTVLLLEKPGGALKAQFTEDRGWRSIRSGKLGAEREGFSY